jgi:hypothetical protein
VIQICGKDVQVKGRLMRVARLDGEQYEFVDNPEQMINGLKTSKARVDLFTFLQRLPETIPQYKYAMELDNLAVLPITTFDNWWNKQVDNKTRNMVRKTEKKGGEIKEIPFDNELVKGIWKIYNECPIRQGRPFPHYGRDVETVRQLLATFPDRSIFIGAYLEGELIGFIKLVTDETGSMAGTMQIISMIQHRDKAPTNALIAQAVRSCAERSIPNLVYANYTYGKRQKDTLNEFKRNNGFQRLDVPRYYVPLTSLGAIGYKLGLHQKLSSHLPEGVGNKLRDWRNAWNNRKLQPVTKTS